MPAASACELCGKHVALQSVQCKLRQRVAARSGVRGLLMFDRPLSLYLFSFFLSFFYPARQGQVFEVEDERRSTSEASPGAL